MKFKIVGDSCCDFTKEELTKDYFSMATYARMTRAHNIKQGGLSRD